MDSKKCLKLSSLSPSRFRISPNARVFPTISEKSFTTNKASFDQLRAFSTASKPAKPISALNLQSCNEKQEYFCHHSWVKAKNFWSKFLVLAYRGLALIRPWRKEELVAPVGLWAKPTLGMTFLLKAIIHQAVLCAVDRGLKRKRHASFVKECFVNQNGCFRFAR